MQSMQLTNVSGLTKIRQTRQMGTISGLGACKRIRYREHVDFCRVLMAPTSVREEKLPTRTNYLRNQYIEHGEERDPSQGCERQKAELNS